MPSNPTIVVVFQSIDWAENSEMNRHCKNDLYTIDGDQSWHKHTQGNYKKS